MAQLKDTLIQGSARVTDTLYANTINTATLSADALAATTTVTAGTTITSGSHIIAGSSTAGAEVNVKAVSNAGEIYFWSGNSNTGNRGIWLKNAGATTSSTLFTINQSNQISAMATIACSPTITGTLTLSKTTDASGTANNSPALIVGGAVTSTHLEFDANEIMAKATGTTVAALFLNNEGGAVNINQGYGTTSASTAVDDSGLRVYSRRASNKGAIDAYSGYAAAASTYTWGFNHLAPNIAAGANTCLLTGVANSTNNQGVLEFHYAGSNNADNYVGLGLYGNNGLVKAYKDKHVEVDTLKITNTSGVAHLTFSRTDNPNYIVIPDGQSLVIANDTPNGVVTAAISINKTKIESGYGASIGSTAYRWGSIYNVGYNYHYATSSSQYISTVYANNAKTAVGELYYDAGNKTNISKGQFGFIEWAPKTTADTSTCGHYERYLLPAATAGITEDKQYTIITTKNLSSITTVGTISSGTWQGTVIDASYLPTATASAKGIMQVGSGLSVSSGTVSINGIDTTNGSETSCLTKKGTWKTFGTSNLALGSTAGAALAASGSAGSATTAAKSDHVHPFPTAANVGAATSDHTHGNITNGGCITTAITVANGDYLIIGDTSASGKLGKGPAFVSTTANKFLKDTGAFTAIAAADLPAATTSAKGAVIVGSGLAVSSGTISISGINTSSGSTAKCLTEKGTWASFTNNAGTVTSITLKAGYNITLDTDNTAITNSGTRTISLSKIQTPLTAASSTAAVTTSPYKSALWTFDLGVSSANLVNGMIITVQIPVATTSYGAYVSVDNGSTYKPVVVSNSTARLTTHYSVNDVVTLFYDADGSCVTYALAGAASTSTITGGCWRVLSSYDSGNSNDAAGYMRQMQNGAYRKTSTALYRYKILLPHKDGIHVIPANTSDIRNNTDYPFSTAMTTITTAEFDITRPIEYYSTTTNLAANANIDGRYHWFMYSGIDLRYSFNTGTTLTAGKDVYLVATVQAGGLTAKLRNPGATGTNAAATATGANAGPITQTLPTSDDGFIYIKLGNAYGTASIVLTPDHPIYYYKDGGIRPFTPTGMSPSGTATKFLNQQGEWTTVSTSDTKVTQAYSTTNNSYPLLFSATAGITSTSSRGDTTAIVNNAIYANPSTGHLYATAVHNAVWNDYAEYRKAADNPEPGRVVIDNDNGTMTLATQRLIPGAQVISDTWGHVMGETDDAKTPIAVAGRVLVYTFQSRENYHAGMAVCSAPDGTVDIMTRKEIRDYPDCIVGIVSEIPDYEEWGSGHVKVNGRIWIKVK